MWPQICEGTKGRLFEVASDTQIVWTYINPVIDTLPLFQGDTVPRVGPYDLKNVVHRSTRYATDYVGLRGHDLTPGYPVERYQTRQFVGVEQAPPAGSVRVGLTASPNPFGRRANISFNLPRRVASELGIYTADGRLVRTLPATTGITWNGTDNAGNRVGRGVYYCRLRGPDFSSSTKLVKTE